MRCDVTDFIHVPGPVDAVLHFASPASPVDYLKLPIETLNVGSLGTLHSRGLALEKGARFVLASTSEVYGDPQVHSQPDAIVRICQTRSICYVDDLVTGDPGRAALQAGRPVNLANPTR